MDEFRTVAALLLFCISAYLLCNLLMAGFDGYVLLGVIGFYLASLLVLPKRRDADRSFDLADTLDLIISFPYQLLVRILRTVSVNDRDGFDPD